MVKKNLKKSLIIGIPAVLIVIAIVVSAILFVPWESDEKKRLEKVQLGEEKLNIILISIDTLRADRLGCYGYDEIDTTNIDKLAAGGVRFAQCKAQVPLTLPSHATMLTGSYPPFHGIRTNDVYVSDESVVNLPEILGPIGYKSAAFVSSVVLFAETGFNQGFDFYNDETRPPDTWGDRKPLQRRADFAWGSAKSWLKDYDNEDPFFMFLHFYDPHSDYDPPPPFDTRYEDDPYVGEIAYVDYVLGDLIPTLKKQGIYENTLIILVSDHGESLGEHGEIEHGVFVYESSVHVPMILHCPGLIPEGKVIEDPVTLADIAPTIYDILGVDMPDVVQGESLVQQIFEKKRGSGDRAIYEESLYMNQAFGWGSIYALEQNGYKYIECPKPELYKLREDPGETENLVEMKPELASEMSEELGKLLVTYTKSTNETGDETPEASGLDELAGLGYFGGGQAEGVFAETPTGEVIDCKDKTDFINTFSKGQTYHLTGQIDKAIEVYENALKEVPDSAFITLQISQAYKEMGDLTKSIEYCEKATEAMPSNVTLQLTLANLYLNARRYEEAEVILSRLKDEDASDKSLSDVYLNLSLLYYFGYHDLDEAIILREKALVMNPKSRKLYYDLAFLYGEAERYEEALKSASIYIDLVKFGPNVETMKIIVAKCEYELGRRTG